MANKVLPNMPYNFVIPLNIGNIKTFEKKIVYKYREYELAVIWEKTRKRKNSKKILFIIDSYFP